MKSKIKSNIKNGLRTRDFIIYNTTTGKAVKHDEAIEKYTNNYLNKRYNFYKKYYIMLGDVLKTIGKKDYGYLSILIDFGLQKDNGLNMTVLDEHMGERTFAGFRSKLSKHNIIKNIKKKNTYKYYLNPYIATKGTKAVDDLYEYFDKKTKKG